MSLDMSDSVRSGGAERNGASTASASIDLSAVRHNLEIVARLCPNSRVLAMVKGNAYGHGLLEVAGALARADGLGVARLGEAIALRKAGARQRIVLLATLLDADGLAACSAHGIDVTVHDACSLAEVLEAVRARPLRVWLKLDSGMHRVGLDPDAFRAADRLLAASPGVIELTHMTHLSSADDGASPATSAQAACFFACHAENSNAKASLANSAALLSRPDLHADWVRPGIMLYGGRVSRDDHVKLRPAMTFVGRVVALRELPAGSAIGYHGTWVTQAHSRIATVGVGYADGYPRHATSGTPVLINGEMARLVGRVSMDFINVDVTACGAIAVGDSAILWGPDLPAALVADHARTIDYALFTGITSRVSRDYSNPA